MNKELEALERLKTAPSFMGGTVEYQACTQSEAVLTQDYEIVKQAVLELKSIKEANHSEALEELKRIDYNITYLLSDCDINEEVDMNFTSIKEHKSCEIIKQALIKGEKEHKALEIIKEKNVDVKLLKLSTNLLDYYTRVKHKTGENTELTEEEFNLLKEVLE